MDINSLRIPGFTAAVSLWDGDSRRALHPPRVGPSEDGDVPGFVQIAEYDPRWPTLYEVEKQRLLTLIGNKIEAIEHFGSTSIPGMCAKPCIDLIIGLRDLKVFVPLERTLSRLGYRPIAYSPDHKWRIVGRNGSVSFRLHMVPYKSHRWIGFLAMRDYLRAHQDLAFDYCRRKRKYAVLHRMDSRAYFHAKYDFVAAAEAKAHGHQAIVRLAAM
jgi:GrpB-like predicted nucleotidyltransferase (UPF0157 family)